MTSRTLTIAVIQMTMTDGVERNVAHAIGFVRDAAARGARLVLLPELFENLYWCQVQRESFFANAHTVEAHPFLPRFCAVARELGVVLPVSFFERSGQAHYNSLAMIDGTGEILGVYRKSHIPDGPGTGKVRLQSRRHGLQGLPDGRGYRGCGNLLGPVVSGERARDGAAGRGVAALPHRDRIRAGGSRRHRHVACCGAAR